MKNRLNFYTLIAFIAVGMHVTCSSQSAATKSNYLDITGMCANTQKIVAEYIQDEWFPINTQKYKRPRNLGISAVSPFIGNKTYWVATRPNNIVYSPCANYIAVSNSQSVKIYGQNNAEIAALNISTLYDSDCTALAFSPHNQLAIAVHNRLVIFDLKSGSFVALNDEQGNTISKMVYSSNGKYLALGFIDGNVTVLRLPDYKRIHNFTVGVGLAHVHIGKLLVRISGLAFTQDSKHLVAATALGDLVVRNMESQQPVFTKIAPQRLFNDSDDITRFSIYDVQCSPVNPREISIVEDGNVTIQNMGTQENRKLIRTVTTPILSCSYSFDGKYLVLGILDGTIEIHDLDQHAQACEEFKRDLAEDGIALLGSFKFHSYSNNNTITLKDHADAVGRVVCSPKSYQFVSASLDNTLKLWQTQGSLVLGQIKKDPLKLHKPDVKVNLMNEPEKKLVAANQAFKTMLLPLIAGEVYGYSKYRDASTTLAIMAAAPVITLPWAVATYTPQELKYYTKIMGITSGMLLCGAGIAKLISK